MRTANGEGWELPADRGKPVKRALHQIRRAPARHLLQAKYGLLATQGQVLRPRPRRADGCFGYRGRASWRGRCRVLDRAADTPDRVSPAQLRDDEAVDEELAIDGLQALAGWQREHQPQGYRDLQQVAVVCLAPQPLQE